MSLIKILGWIDVSWDSGGSNSYRMGAEGKYDLQLAPSHDPEKLRRDSKSEISTLPRGRNANPLALDPSKTKVRPDLPFKES